MSIRTSYVAAPERRAMISGHALPVFFSASAWPGLRAWLCSVLCSTGIFSLLAGFAWHGTNAHMPDMVTLLVAIPAGTFIAILIAASLFTLLARAPFEAGLALIARVLPLAWIAPLIDLLTTAGKGVIMPVTPLDAPGYALATITASLLPVEATIPIGMRVGIASAVLITIFVMWFSRKKIVHSLSAGLVMSAALVKLSFFPSALGVWHVLTHGEGWVRGVVATSHATLRAVTNGYWWNNVYDRFPSAVDAQADIAIRLTSAGITALALGVVLTALFVWRVPRWRQLLLHVFGSWSTLHIAIDAIGAAIITVIALHKTSMVGTWWYAIPLAVLGIAAMRLHMVCARCLAQTSDAADPTNPLVCGDASSSDLADISLLALLYAVLVACALGWPVLAALLVFLAASWLSRDSLWRVWPWSATVFRAAGTVALALAGYFFASQQASLSGTAALIALLAIAHRLILEIFWQRK